MSTLSAFGRPWVEFDAQNKDHRRHFAQYLRNNSWGRCPYRFFVNGHMIPVAAMRQKMLEYYANKEFGKTKS